MRRVSEEMHAMRLFDYLIFNTDRHVRNVVFGQDWRPVAIDNSISFHAFLRPFRPLYRFPRGPLDRLRRLDAGALQSALGRYLDADEIAALRQRRERVLQRADEATASDGAAAVFDW